MKSDQLGKSTSIKVLGVNQLGLWLLADNEEHFLSFKEFPWFELASVKAVFNVEKQGRFGLCWPDLDVDLTIDGIKHPEHYPLRAKH